ncbi:hypothetical protein PHLGIDRAFT_255333 [Phlebiopsis gigantea 11061_1 CR5-6]|uniref:Uncharacterized protein n=1 Tax=Phlebiopsis gigantea (strain 11061_1 CR5-6) TaxID=745531 RepID=A0A0C3PD16_PHLG1|nr:hypothetical protein PHLGIDRAFT_255333 [Phlebiopsis gigantea 11061_1 CR5-6]
MASARRESLPEPPHCLDVNHEIYIDCTTNTDEYVTIATLALCIYERYAPHVCQPPDVKTILDGDYRWAILRFCVGRCAHPEKKEPEATLELWDKLEDHAERAKIRFTVYLRADIIDNGTGRVLAMQREWTTVLRNLKVYVRDAMWWQVQQWAQHDNRGTREPELPDNWREIWYPLRAQIAAGKWTQIDRLPRWENYYQTDRYIYQQKDGDFGLSDRIQTWSDGGPLPLDEYTGRPLEIRPGGMRRPAPLPVRRR